MKKKQGLDDSQILNAIDQEVRLWESEGSTKLAEQRSNAMDYYLGQPFPGNTPVDGSTVVTREVMDTIEWIKPELMKKFAAGNDTVRFEPVGPDDVPAAEQATQYVAYLFNRKNEGFKILYQWITDGLLQKNGIVKCWWDTDKSVVREEYEGLSDLELQMLLADERVELLEQETIAPQMGSMNPGATHNVAVAVTGGQSGLTIENIPPEEYIISARGKGCNDTPFQCHRRLMTVSDLRAMGYEVEEGDTGLDYDSGVSEYEKQARHDYDDTNPTDYGDSYSDESMREVWVDEAYIHIDANGDGIAELLKVCKSGTTIFSQEEVSHAPFAGWTPIIISHKFHGLSMADLVMDLQRLQSQLFRNMLDNQYLTNNGKYAVLENMVNMEDMLHSSPHSSVRIKTPGALQRIDVPQLGSTAFQMLEYVEKMREKRTGTSERTAGLDPNSLSPNTAAGAVNQVMTAAQQRIELIARVFGETGLKDLFRLIYAEVCQNATSTEVFRLNNEYVEVDPREWKERKDLTVVVGLGNGSQDNELQQAQMFFQNQMTLLNNPKTTGLVTDANVFNVMEDMVALTNKASSGRYYTDPRSPEAQKAKQEQQQMQQKMQQQQEQINQMQAQIDKQNADAKTLSAQAEAKRKQSQTAIEQAELQQDALEHEDDIALRTAELQLEATLEAEQKRGVELG
jgi:hypothetical protein